MMQVMQNMRKYLMRLKNSLAEISSHFFRKIILENLEFSSSGKSWWWKERMILPALLWTESSVFINNECREHPSSRHVIHVEHYQLHVSKTPISRDYRTWVMRGWNTQKMILRQVLDHEDLDKIIKTFCKNSYNKG